MIGIQNIPLTQRTFLHQRKCFMKNFAAKSTPLILLLQMLLAKIPKKMKISKQQIAFVKVRFL